MHNSSDEGHAQIDAVHRRFITDEKIVFKCEECLTLFQDVSTNNVNAFLNEHYKRCKPLRKPSECVYCKKPVYRFNRNNSIHIFHTCNYN